MGRTPQPAALKLIKGRAPGKDSAGRDVNPGPAFKRLPPEAPAWLSDEARAEWDRVLPGLSRLDLLKPEDRAALAAYCETWASFREATETVAREGLTIDAKQGTLPHPAVGIARSAGRELRAWAAHFGLTPSTEQALARGAENEPDPDNPFG
ncbi:MULTISPECIES: phage terminase small subunit P27 family [unclassified Streptomyces]|uniref:phage terminase small subunit P27 family n=1 Tax=unclassified Streptomyces TaxID=2593676 RepID=UPI000804E78A|nr:MULTISPECIES: phage terminase small subunit P27 family [unclassified Streptomyces]MYR76544.1 phage terminase small subunit P27 family [Streptomyces sp. SID4925]SBV00032.1 phage terminase, small subunit, putative, P27 family [Streptomyces sp. OspMP-M45]